MMTKQVEEMTEDQLYAYAHMVEDAILRLTDAMQILIETDDMEVFRDTMSVDDYGLCICCPGSATFRDALNIPWCDTHRDRGEFVSFMAHRHWKGIKNAPIEYEDGDIGIYTIDDGAFFVAHTALGGSDEAIIALALVAMEQASFPSHVY